MLEPELALIAAKIRQLLEDIICDGRTWDRFDQLGLWAEMGGITIPPEQLIATYAITP